MRSLRKEGLDPRTSLCNRSATTGTHEITPARRLNCGTVLRGEHPVPFGGQWQCCSLEPSLTDGPTQWLTPFSCEIPLWAGDAGGFDRLRGSLVFRPS